VSVCLSVCVNEKLKKGKAISKQSWTGAYGSKVEVPRISGQSAHKVANLTAQTTCLLYLPGDTLVLISVRG